MPYASEALCVLLLAGVAVWQMRHVPEPEPEPPCVVRFPPAMGHKTPWRETRRPR